MASLYAYYLDILHYLFFSVLIVYGRESLATEQSVADLFIRSIKTNNCYKNCEFNGGEISLREN